MKTAFVILLFISVQLLVATKQESNKTADDEIGEALNNYLKRLSKEGALDYTIILTSNQYYDDGSLQQIDTLAFSSQAEDNALLKNFNLSSLSKGSIKKLLSDANADDVLLSLTQEIKNGDTSETKDFDTIQIIGMTSAAANVVLHPDGFMAGIEGEIRDAMDLTESVATIEVLEYFEEGSVKRNTTTNVYSNKVNVIDSYKMSPRMIQTSTELLRKAYKIDMDDRAPFITKLFSKEYPTYEWKVIANLTIPIEKKGVSVTLTTGQDKYHVVGVLKNKPESNS